MKKILVVLLEDDPIDQIKIEIMLSESIGEQYKFCLVGIFTQLDDLLSYFSNHKVDLILSDIFIQNKAVGIELVKKLRDTPTPVVLMTLSQEHGLFAEVQSYRSVHYLIKPFHAISLQSAIQKSLEEYNKSKLYDFVDKKYLYLSGKANKKEQVLLHDIVYVEAEDSYCYIYTLSKKYILKKSLSKLLVEDLSSQFLRIHHKYAVNLIYVQNSKTDSVQLTEQVVLPVGKSFKKEVNEFLKRHIQGRTFQLPPKNIQL